MPETITVTLFGLRRRVGQLLELVAHRRTPLLVTRHGRPFVLVCPLAEESAPEAGPEVIEPGGELAVGPEGVNSPAKPDVNSAASAGSARPRRRTSLAARRKH